MSRRWVIEIIRQIFKISANVNLNKKATPCFQRGRFAIAFIRLKSKIDSAAVRLPELQSQGLSTCR